MNRITVDNFEETPEMQAEALAQARREIGPTNVAEINLAKEEIVSIGLLQNPDGTTTEAEHTHAVVTFLSPAFGQQLSADGTPGFKIYGAYCSNEAALAAAAQIRDYHTELYGKPIFGIIVVEMGKITPFPMTREQLNKIMTNKEASDEALNEMISNYRTEQKKAQILFEKRKDTLVKSAKEFTALERARQLREAAAAAESSTPGTESPATAAESSSSTVASAGAGGADL